MPPKQSAWTHGTSVQLQTKSWTADRQGFFTTVRPSSGGETSGWVHFAIPTVGLRLKAKSAMIRFSTGSQASIRAIDVYDGEDRIYQSGPRNLQGTLVFHLEPIHSQPEVKWGTGISLLVHFNGTGPNAYIQLIGAGIEFD